MGLPQVLIEFKSKATSAVQRSQKGVVALLIRDTVADTGIQSFKGIDEVGETTYSEQNRDYIAKTFMGTPSKVIVVNIGEEGTINEGLTSIKSLRWNYLAVPFANEETTDIASFIKGQRENKKTFKTVLANEPADSEGIINFTTDEIKVGDRVYTTAEYTCRVAGVLAGLPFTRSATYYAFNEVDSIKEHDDPNAAIENGEFILIFDGIRHKVGRSVNSLTTHTSEKSKQFSKITIVDKMDQVKDDIRDTFDNNYVGLTINDYNSKMLFFSACNAYFQQLVLDSVLDASGENNADINFTAQRLYLQSNGVNVDDMTVQEIREYNTGSKVFVGASVRFTDTMEDLYFDISV